MRISFPPLGIKFSFPFLGNGIIIFQRGPNNFKTTVPTRTPVIINIVSKECFPGSDRRVWFLLLVNFVLFLNHISVVRRTRNDGDGGEEKSGGDEIEKIIGNKQFEMETGALRVAWVGMGGFTSATRSMLKVPYEFPNPDVYVTIIFTFAGTDPSLILSRCFVPLVRCLFYGPCTI